MTRKRIVLAALSALFLLTGCNKENPAKKNATKEYFLTYSKEYYIKFRDDAIPCTGLHYDTREYISKAVQSVEFTAITDSKEIESLEKTRLISEISTHHSVICFWLYPDFIHAAFTASSGGGNLHSPVNYTSFQKIKKEDGERLFETIKKAYQAGNPVSGSTECHI